MAEKKTSCKIRVSFRLIPSSQERARRMPRSAIFMRQERAIHDLKNEIYDWAETQHINFSTNSWGTESGDRCWLEMRSDSRHAASRIHAHLEETGYPNVSIISIDTSIETSMLK
jgi:hypothetical protein